MFDRHLLNEEIFMKTKKNLILRLTIVSFALNIVSIFLAILNQPQEKVVDIETTTYQKPKALIDTEKFISTHGPLVEDFSGFPRNIAT